MEEYVNEAEKVSDDNELKEVYDMEYEYTNVGFERGMQAGTEKGQLLKQQEIAKNMLKEKLDEKLISNVTNLTPNEIESLKEELNTEE